METGEKEILEKHEERSKTGFDALKKYVIDQTACSFCGTCVSICPEKSVELGSDFPILNGDCNQCGICYLACPRTFLPATAIQKWLFEKEDIPPLGSCVRAECAGSTSKEILEKAPDGGVITTLFSYFLDENIFDAVITSGRKHDISWCYHPEPRVVTDSKDLISCIDKKYDPNPLLTVLPEAMKYDKVAFVGLACHVQALRKLQYAAHNYQDLFPAFAKAADRLTRNIKFVIGIGDIGRFGRGKIDVLLNEYGSSGEEEVSQYFEERISGDFVFKLHKGGEIRIPQSEVIRYPQPFCFLCNDFNGYASDMSVDRSEFQAFNVVMMRNQDAEKLFTQCLEKGMLQTRELPDEGRDFIEGMAEMLKGFTDYDLYGYEHYLNNGEFKIDEAMGQMFGDKKERKLRGLPENMMMELLKKYPQYGFCVNKRKELGYENPDIF